jgi:hypothetical protein
MTTIISISMHVAGFEYNHNKLNELNTEAAVFLPTLQERVCGTTGNDTTRSKK